MAKRLHPSPADYLVIAVSPAMIMTLVGSLIFFLLAILYQGQYPERLHFVMALFIFAAVLIGRISIEMGSEYALGYATPLAIVTILALQKFVEYPPGPLATYSLPINTGLIGLIWWCAHKLTWDCTFIDESKEESGEGVLKTMGLDPRQEKPRKRGQNSFSGATPPPPERASAKKSSDPLLGKETPREAKPRPHSGGVWVVYFSLAALPIFGFGQRFIPAADQEQRRYVFLLLAVYVASGLGLLLTTSFLGLRRYLRGRQLQMPATMALSWVTIGCILAAAILAFALLLPRPSPEYAISELPWRMTSADRSASKYAVGKEGTPDANKNAASGEDHSPPAARKNRTPPPSGPKGTESSKTAEDTKAGSSGEGAKGGSQDQGGKSGAQDQGAKGQSQEQSGKSGSQDQGGKSGTQDQGAKGQSQEQGDKSGSAEQKSQADSKGGSQGDDAKGRSGEQKSDKGEEKGSKGGSSGGRSQKTARDNRGGNRDAKSQQPSQGGRSQQNSPPPPPPPARAPKLPSLPLAAALKWLLYLAMAVAIGYALWRSRAAVADALRDFLNAWRAFWARLFGGKAAEAAAEGEAAAAPGPAPKRLSEFVDPFASGWAERWPPDTLVQYSFAALEAWGRENGFPRAPEQTPHEFAEGVGDRAKRLARPSRRLAELYCRVAYAPGTLAPAAAAPLREFWAHVQTSSLAPPAAASGSGGT